MSDTPNPTYIAGQFDPRTLHDPFRTFTVATLNVRGANKDHYFHSQQHSPI